MSPDAVDWTEAWEHALAGIEMDVERAEALLAAGTTTSPPVIWSPPEGIGLIPRALEVRARALLERQLELATHLAAAARDSRRHDRVLSRMTSTEQRPPVYFDTPV